MTALFWSVMRVTLAPSPVTSVTSPTRPSSVMTGAFLTTPSSFPAAIMISWLNGLDGRRTTVATIGLKSVGYLGPLT